MNEDANQPEVLDEEVVQPVVEDQGEQAESSPAQAEKPEQKKSDGVQKRINDLVAKRYEEKRRADELEARLKELVSQQPKAEPQSPTPTQTEAPKVPENLYDSEAMAKYQNDLIAYNAKVAQEAAQRAFQESQKTGLQEKQEQERKQKISQWAKNAVSDGVDLDKLRSAEQVLAQDGLTKDLGDYIMKDQHGPKIAEYLFDNPELRYQILNLDPVSAGVKIMTEVKPKALSQVPKVSNAPDPVPDIVGGGAVDKDEFERLYPDTQFI